MLEFCRNSIRIGGFSIHYYGILIALGALLGVPMEEILVPVPVSTEPIPFEQQADVCCSFFLLYRHRRCLSLNRWYNALSGGF